MAILITGASGMLGSKFVSVLSRLASVIATDVNELDICNANAVKSFFSVHSINLVINCAAYTAVDQAEKEPEKARQINVIGPLNLSAFCSEYDIPLVHFSTDYVFDGMSTVPYVESDIRHPLGVYGQTKAAGEDTVTLLPKHFLIRTAWLYGENGKNFVMTMLRLSQEKNELNVVNDQLGSPTYTGDLVDWTMQLVHSKVYGTYHVTNEGICTWFEFAQRIFELTKRDIILHPCTSDAFPTAAKRPQYSVLSKNKLETVCGKKPRLWEIALKEYLTHERLIV